MKTIALASAALCAMMGCANDKPTLDVDVRGEGTVKSNPPGIDCPGKCSAQFDKGTAVALTAKGADGSQIRFEVGELPPSTDTQRVLMLDKSMRVTVTLTPGIPTTPPPTAPSPFPTPARGDPGLPTTEAGFVDGGPMQPKPSDVPPTPPPG